MAKNKQKKINFKLSKFSPLRISNFMLSFALIGVLYLLFASAATTPGFYGSTEKDQANRINSTRSANGVHQLWHIECLNAIAEYHAKEMADAGKIFHTDDANRDGTVTPGESNKLAERVSYGMTKVFPHCGTDWTIIGENVGVGYSSDTLFNAFISSPTHKANILGTRFSRMGIGAYHTSDGRVWVTQLFAHCSKCKGNWSKSVVYAVDPTTTSPPPTTTPPPSSTSCTNKTPTVTLANLGLAAKPSESGTVQTTTTSSEIRDYYYASAGTRYTYTFVNHTIDSINPNAPVVSGSHAHPTGDASATGKHDVKLDYNPLFNSNPGGTYTPKVSYRYTWNFTQSLWVKRFAKNADGSKGNLLYVQESSGGTGVTASLTRIVQNSSSGSVYGPTMGPCN